MTTLAILVALRRLWRWVRRQPAPEVVSFHAVALVVAYVMTHPRCRGAWNEDGRTTIYLADSEGVCVLLDNWLKAAQVLRTDSVDALGMACRAAVQGKGASA